MDIFIRKLKFGTHTIRVAETRAPTNTMAHMVTKRSFDDACRPRGYGGDVELNAEKKCRSATSIVTGDGRAPPRAAPRGEAPPSRRLVFARRRAPAASSPSSGREADARAGGLGESAEARLAAACPPHSTSSVIEINNLLLWQHHTAAARACGCAPGADCDDEWGQFVAF